MRIGLIGAGRIGRVHAGTLSALPAVDLLVADADAARARQLAAETGAEAVTDPEAVFDAVDGVVIAASSDAHAPLLVRAAKSRVPAFCEKPIALDLSASRSALEVVTEAGIPVQMGFQRRFDPGYRRVRDMVAGGDLGTVYLLRHTSHDHEPPPADYVATSGGLFADNLIHDFDVARYVSGGQVEGVYATGTVRVADYFADHDDVDTAAVVLRLTGGALAVLSAVRHDPIGYDVRLEVLGSADSVATGWSARTPMASVDSGVDPQASLDPAPQAPVDPAPDPTTAGGSTPGLDPDAGADPSDSTPDRLRRPARPFRTWTDRFADAYRLELEAFLDLVATGRRDIAATAADAHEALRIAVACRLSRTEQRPVSLSEVP